MIIIYMSTPHLDQELNRSMISMSYSDFCPQHLTWCLEQVDASINVIVKIDNLFEILWLFCLCVGYYISESVNF